MSNRRWNDWLTAVVIGALVAIGAALLACPIGVIVGAR